jgi:hypothetical protein
LLWRGIRTGVELGGPHCLRLHVISDHIADPSIAKIIRDPIWGGPCANSGRNPKKCLSKGKSAQLLNGLNEIRR